MKEIKLTITIEEANQILDALGTQPFKTVFNLIGKIQQQAAAQLQDQGTNSTKALNLTFTVDEANQILEALGDQPFKTVFALIGKIQQQGGAQLREPEPATPSLETKIANKATTIDTPKVDLQSNGPET